MRLYPSVSTYRLQTVKAGAGSLSFLAKRGKKIRTFKKFIISNPTQCRPDSSAFLLLWADSGGNQPCHKGCSPYATWIGMLGLAAGQALPPQPGVPASPNPVRSPLGAITCLVPASLRVDSERITEQPRGSHLLVQRPCFQGWVF